MEKLKSAFAMNGMGAIKPFNLTSIFKFESGLVKMPDFGKLEGHSFVWSHSIKMASFHHEGARGN